MTKGQIPTVLVIVIGLFIVSGLILSLPNSIGIENKSMVFSIMVIILGLFGITKMFKAF